MDDAIPTQKMSPEAAAARRVEMAKMIQRAADAEVGKETGVEEDLDTPSPRVWVVVDDDMKRVLRLTGKEGFEGASDDARAYLEQTIPRIEQYIAVPHFLDTFDEHPSRREWGKVFIKPLGSDVYEYFKSNKLSMNFLIALRTAFIDIAKKTADLDCEEAVYVRGVVATMGTPEGIPDVVAEFAGDDRKEDGAPLGKLTKEDAQELLRVFMSGEVPEMKTKAAIYDRMDPEEKWGYAKRYLDACKGLVDILEKKRLAHQNN